MPSNAVKKLKGLLAFLKDEPPPLEESNKEDESSNEMNGPSDELERAKQEYSLMQGQFLKTLQQQEDKIAQTKQNIQKLSQPLCTTITSSTHGTSPPASSRGCIKPLLLRYILSCKTDRRISSV